MVKMTSNLRRKLAETILDFMNLKSSTMSPDFLASVMYTSRMKGNSDVEIHLPLEQCHKHFPSLAQDINKITLNSKEFPYGRVSNERGSDLAFGVQQTYLLQNVLGSIINSSDLWKGNVGFSNSKKLKVVVEFSSPNIAKPFHAGHLRSTILGNFVANVHQAAGHDVIRLNYLGDWGTQFGTLIKGFRLYGDESNLESDPIQHLFQVYVEANKLIEKDPDFLTEARKEFQKLEQNDPALQNLWQKFRQFSIDDFCKTYERLGIRFDVYEGESFYHENVKQVYELLEARGLLKHQPDGTKSVDYEHPGGIREVVLQKSDGSSLYLSRDIAAAISRKEKFNFDKMFYVVENGQNDHFLALFDILKRMGHSWASQLTHVKFGRILGMSTRKGTVVFLKDILDEARTLTVAAMKASPNTRVSADKLEEIGDVLGVSAVLINDMRSRRQQDINFNWDTVTQTKGDTGVFLLYVHARLCSLEDNCGITINTRCDLVSVVEPEAINLVYQLARYEDVCTLAFTELMPNIIVKYLFSLGRRINSALDTLRVKGEPVELAEPRLMLFTASRYVLADGMRILGLTPLRQM